MTKETLEQQIIPLVTIHTPLPLETLRRSLDIWMGFLKLTLQCIKLITKSNLSTAKDTPKTIRSVLPVCKHPTSNETTRIRSINVQIVDVERSHT